MNDRVARSDGRKDWSTWPRYDAAVLGLRNYWYPATWSWKVRSKPVPITLLGERLVFIRDHGRVYALHDRCAHRGVPLSLRAGSLGQRGCARPEFPGTISCGYHGWTYELATGTLVAALTDGPDSPICGKVRIRTYPVEERIGIVWVYIGDLDPPPVEADIPEELLTRPHTKGGRISIREGNWRYAAENGFDEAHPRYLHRNSAWLMRQQIPGWTRSGVKMLEDGTIEGRPGDDDPGAIALLRKLSRVSRKRWPETAVEAPRLMPPPKPKPPQPEPAAAPAPA